MPQPKDRDKIKDIVDAWRANGDKVVFTNGCFDILHLGHVQYLEVASEMGDRLVVGVNDDASVRSLEKGEERPINPELARAAVVAALKSVDATVIFSEPTPLELIKLIEPDVLVKGADYDAEEKDSSSKKYIIGSAEVKAKGGEVKTVELVPGYSTTAIINKSKKT